MKYQAVVEAFKLEKYDVNELWHKGVSIRQVNSISDPMGHLALVFKEREYKAYEGNYVVVFENDLGIYTSKLFNEMFKECELIGSNNKTLNNSTVNQAKDQVKDIEVYGDGDTFRLLCKASSVNEGWMKSTKVCNVDGGCIVQVTTQQKNPDGSYAVAEALTFIPHNRVNIDVEPRKIEPIDYSLYFESEDKQ